MADYTSMAVLGVEFDDQCIETKPILVKIGEHSFDQETRFHPKTGAMLWEERRVPKYELIDEYDGPADNGYTVSLDPGAYGLEVFAGTDGSPVVVGFGVSDTYSNGGEEHDFAALDEKKVKDIRESCEKLFEGTGLNPEFGLHAVQRCSY